MKTKNIIINSIMKNIVNRALAAKKNVVKCICAVVMLLGMSVSAWGADPGSGYTKVTSINSLSTGDYVVLYSSTSEYGISGIGNCVDGDYVSGYEATVSATEGMWIQYYVTKSNDSFTLKDKAANKFVVRSSNSFTYGDSGTSFTVSNAGGLVESSKSLIATTVFSGKSCERASARWGTPGTLYAIYKLSSDKVKDGSDQYTVTPSTMTFTADMDDADYDSYYHSYDFTVTLKYAFGGGVYAELLVDGDDYSYVDTGHDGGYIASKNANSSPSSSTINIAVSAYTPNGTYSGYVHVYPTSNNKTTDIEYYIPVTYTITNSWAAACTQHVVVYGYDGNGSDPTGDDSGCENDAMSFTPSPNDGYRYNGATIYEDDGTTPITTLNANTTSFSMYNRDIYVIAHYTAQNYTITLNNQSATTAGTPSISVTYGASTNLTGTPAITVPEKTGNTFNGYYTATNGGGVQIIAANGNVIAEVDDGVNIYTSENKEWLYAGNINLYAYWTTNSHTLAVENETYISTVTATPSSSSAVSKNCSGTVNYGETVTLSYSGITNGYAFMGWDVFETGNSSNKVTVTNNQFTMPDHNVTVDALLYDKSKMQTRCQAEVEMTITGSVYLTSYAGVTVYTTNNPNNLITVTCDDFGSANKLGIQYLVNGSPVAKASSLFRLCYYNYSGQSDYGVADGSNDGTYDYISLSTDAIKAQYASTGQTFAISYTPGAEEYNQTDTYTLRLIALNGSTDIGHKDIELHGRALPQKFVIAAKIDGVWKALPADIRTTSGTMDKDPYPISVNDADEPTTAYYAPKAALYSGAARPTGAVNSNRGGIRLHTETGTNDGYLQGGRSNTSASLWRTTYGCSTGMQSWYLTSSDFGNYKVNVDPNIYVSSGSGEGDDGEGSTSTLLDRKLCVNAGKIGWYKTSADDFRILKVTNEVELREATVYEWGEHGVVLNADMTDVASVTAHIENGTPSAATVTAVNAASLTAGKYVKVDAGALTIGAIANEKKVLNLHWKNSGGTEIGVSSIVIPRVIASSGTMSTLDATKGNWNTEVHVLPGQTLTADGGSFGSSTVVVKQLIVYPGATVNVSTGTLTATTLRLRNGWTRAGSTQYNTARVYIADDAALTKTTASMDYDIYNSAEGRHYYPLAVPFQTAVSTIDYADATLATASVYNKHFVIKEYNGARRATNGEDRENNWTVVSGSGNLDPCKGYIITAVAVKGEAIIRVPLSYNDGWTADGELATYSATTKNVIAVTAHTGTAASAHNRHKGWNMLGVPFMSCYGNVDDIYSGGGSAALINGELVVNTSADENMEYQSTTIPYVSVPSHDFAEYIQTDISEAELRPGWSFLVQVNTSGNLTFAVGNQQTGDAGQVYAPRRMTEEDVVVKTGIILSDAESSDKTTILVSDQYSLAEYEIGADLEKMFGTGYTLAVYSLSNDTRLAYNAMSPTDAQQAIPLGFRAPADGEYTFSLNPKYADAPLERVDLIDYQLGTLTNLLTSSYTFQTGQTQSDTRFALNIVKQKETPTDVETVTGDGLPVNGVYKVLINEQLYIIQGDKMYDATGKRVKGINK